MDEFPMTVASYYSNFNGAMAVRPWMEMRRAERLARLGQLQWGHGREAMDGRYSDPFRMGTW